MLHLYYVQLMLNHLKKLFPKSLVFDVISSSQILIYYILWLIFFFLLIENVICLK